MISPRLLRPTSSTETLTVHEAQSQLLKLRDRRFNPKSFRFVSPEIPKSIANVLFPRTINEGKLYFVDRHTLMFVSDSDRRMEHTVTINITESAPENKPAPMQIRSLRFPRSNLSNTKIDDSTNLGIVGSLFEKLGRPFEILSRLKDSVLEIAGL